MMQNMDLVKAGSTLRFKIHIFTLLMFIETINISDVQQYNFV